MSESPKVKCPNCGRRGLRRMIGTGAGLIFKGSGFYQTDYKNNNDTSDKEPKDSKPAKDTAKDSAQKSDSTSSAKDSSQSA